MKVKKKSFIIVMIILAIIILISVMIGIVIPIIQKSQIKNNLSKINATDFENKIIERLKDSKLNVNTSTLSTEIGTYEEISKNANDNLKLRLSSIGLLYEMEQKEELYKDYVSAFVGESVVIIPLFRIEKDSNGNFKSIEYVESQLGVSVETIIFDVLKEEYNINIKSKYKSDMTKLYGNNSIGIAFLLDEDAVEVEKQIQNKYAENVTIEERAELIREEKSTEIFGIDINE